MLETYQWMEYTRSSYLLTKQEMAKRLDISVRTYTLAITQKKVSTRIVKKLEAVWGYQHIEQSLFESINHKLTLLYRNILYVDYTRAKSLITEINEYQSWLEHSNLVKTYLLYIFMYLTHAQDMLFDIDYIRHQCHLLEPYMNKEEKNLYAIVLNGYHYVKGDHQKSNIMVRENIEKVSNPHLRALSYFLIGASSVNEVGQIEKSLEYLKIAQGIFEEYANYARAQRCQAFMLVGLVHSRRYDEFFEGYTLFQNIPVLKEDRKRVLNFIEGTKARYYLLTHQTKDALKVLEKIKGSGSNNQFFKIMAYLQTSDKERLSLLIDEEKKKPLIENRYHLQLLEIIEQFLNKNDEKQFLNQLLKVLRRLYDSRDFISVMLISDFAANIAKKHRRFKDAHTIMQKKLALLC